MAYQLRDLMNQNTLYNQDTGRSIPILDEYGNPSQSQQAGPSLDYSQPIEIGGYGKGYRLKNDPMSVMLSDGRMVRMGADTGAERRRELEDLKLAELKQKVYGGGPSGQDWMKDFDASGRMLLVNRRTGEIKRPAEDIVGAQYSPELAGQMVTAKDTASQGVKKTGAMEGLAGTIDTAQTLLEGRGPGQKGLPTSSSIGSAYDAAAGWFGASPDGAAEAQKLKVLGGALTSKMPRMEGPQSDKDTQAYREMAGMVGDETIPIARRLAALDEVKNLWAKYDKQSSGAAMPNDPSHKADWVVRAKAKNPGMSGAAIEAEYIKKFRR